MADTPATADAPAADEGPVAAAPPFARHVLVVFLDGVGIGPATAANPLRETPPAFRLSLIHI